MVDGSTEELMYSSPKHEFAHAFNEVQRIQMMLTIMSSVLNRPCHDLTKRLLFSQMRQTDHSGI